jgi:A/G-specific adenine glycosylase
VDAPYSVLRFRHTFSHYHLDIDVQSLNVDISDAAVLEARERVWYNSGELPGGVAAPVTKILNNLVGELL